MVKQNKIILPIFNIFSKNLCSTQIVENKKKKEKVFVYLGCGLTKNFKKNF